MLFNSQAFAVFFLTVFSLYLLLARHHQWQNRMLLVASYIFYGSWNWRFLGLLMFTTTVDYWCGRGIGASRDAAQRRRLLCVSIGVNLAVLGFFKYVNFFAGSLARLLARAGAPVSMPMLHIILPVGVSFYTFQSLSYIIDVYRRDAEPTRPFLDFALFIAFFPQLIAGPIERVTHLRPQIERPRRVTWVGVREGVYLILWGLFQKVFVADALARLVDPVFGPVTPTNGALVLVALYAFAFQIYCDFAGYTSMARGLAKCLGFELIENFRQPYVSKNPREFWQRWHISLSTWLRDYLYIPLGGSRGGPWQTARNLLLTMAIGGLWHGAAWTFVCWGLYHGMLLVAHRAMAPMFAARPEIRGRVAQRAWALARMVATFHLVCVGWLLFRATSLTQAGRLLRALCSAATWRYDVDVLMQWSWVVFLLWAFWIIESLQHWSDDAQIVRRAPAAVRGLVYAVMLIAVGMAGVSGGRPFIYFQF